MKPIIHLLGNKFIARRYLWFAEKKLKELKAVMDLQRLKFGQRRYRLPDSSVEVFIQSYLGVDKIRIAAVAEVKGNTVHLTLPILIVQSNPVQVLFHRPTQDTYIFESLPDTNFGTGSNMIVGKASVPFLVRRAIVQFDLSSSNVLSSQIDTAILEIFLGGWSASNPSGRTHVANRYTNSGWGETTVTWNNGNSFTTVDSVDTVIAAGPPTSPYNAYISWDIADQVKYAIDNEGSIVDVLIKDSDETVDHGSTYITREGNISQREQLTLTLL